jgi:chromosome segregation ATPase
MAEGDTNEQEVAQIRQALEDARQALEDAKEEATKQSGIAENAEKKFLEHTQEVGNTRKELEALKAKNAELESVKKQEDEGMAKVLDEEVKILESKLSADGEKAMDTLFEAADNEEKLKLVNNKEFRKAVLQQVLNDAGPIIPDTWKVKTKEQQEEDKNKSVLALFDKAKNRSAFVPRTESGGAHGPLKPGEPPKGGKPQDGKIAQDMFKSYRT